MTIGEKIKYCRKQIGITQDKLAELTGIHPVSIRKYETNKMQPQPPQLEKIAAALGVSYNALNGNDTAGLRLETVGDLMGVLMVLCNSGILQISGERGEDKLLKDDTVSINKSSVDLKDSKEYEVLTTSEIYKVKNSNEIDTYALDIKNTSKKQLGNITVKIGQLDKDGTYIMVDSISLYNILKPSEDIKMEIKALDNTKSIELLGYSYDDIKEKANINIDLKLHKASISG